MSIKSCKDCSKPHSRPNSYCRDCTNARQRKYYQDRKDKPVTERVAVGTCTYCQESKRPVELTEFIGEFLACDTCRATFEHLRKIVETATPYAEIYLDIVLDNSMSSHKVPNLLSEEEKRKEAIDRELAEQSDREWRREEFRRRLEESDDSFPNDNPYDLTPPDSAEDGKFTDKPLSAVLGPPSTPSTLTTSPISPTTEQTDPDWSKVTDEEMALLVQGRTIPPKAKTEPPSQVETQP